MHSVYGARLSKILWFVSGNLHWQITVFCDNRVQYLFYHSMTEFVFHSSQQLNHFLKARESKLPFSDKSMVSITHEENIICSKTVICRSRGGLVGYFINWLPKFISSSIATTIQLCSEMSLFAYNPADLTCNLLLKSTATIWQNFRKSHSLLYMYRFPLLSINNYYCLSIIMVKNLDLHYILIHSWPDYQVCQPMLETAALLAGQHFRVLTSA